MPVGSWGEPGSRWERGRLEAAPLTLFGSGSPCGLLPMAVTPTPPRPWPQTCRTPELAPSCWKSEGNRGEGLAEDTTRCPLPVFQVSSSA